MACVRTHLFSSLTFTMSQEERKLVELKFVPDDDVIFLATLSTVKNREKKHTTPKRTSQNTESNLDSPENDCLQPKELFEKNEVRGGDIYTVMKTPQRKTPFSKSTGSAIKKTPVADSRNAETPKSSRKIEIHKRNISSKQNFNSSAANCNGTPSTGKDGQIPKTPYSLRQRLKSEIVSRRLLLEQEREFSSGSDYDPSEESDSSSSSDNDNDSDKDVFVEPKEKQKKIENGEIAKKGEDDMFSLRRSRRIKENDCVIDSEEYFARKTNKTVTSNNSLSKLKTPKLLRDEMGELLSNEYVKHKNELYSLQHEYEAKFRLWLFYLKEGYNLVMYGLGSKMKFINSFCSKMLSNNVLIINGFFPGLTMKEILTCLLVDIFRSKQCPPSINAAMDLIKKLSGSFKSMIFLAVHNIDGISLRDEKHQEILCKLVSLKNIRMIASIDHLNAPLLWGNSKLSSFNFLWLDVTTFTPYVSETSFENSLLIQQSGSSLVLSSLSNVFKSLTTNAKKVFKLLAKDHLDNKHNKQYKGVSFSDLYLWARDALLVSSDLALRTQLTEFIDHEVVKWKHSSDCLTIPINLDILSIFYEQQYGSEE